MLDDVDVGYALLPEYWSKGYASEAVRVVMQYAGESLGMRRVVAVVNTENASSIRLLEKVGFRYERMVRLTADAREVKLFAAETAISVCNGALQLKR